MAASLFQAFSDERVKIGSPLFLKLGAICAVYFVLLLLTPLVKDAKVFSQSCHCSVSSCQTDPPTCGTSLKVFFGLECTGGSCTDSSDCGGGKTCGQCEYGYGSECSSFRLCVPSCSEGGATCYGAKTGPCGGDSCPPTLRYYYQYCENIGWHGWCTLPNSKQPSCSCIQQNGLRREYFKKGTGYGAYSTESYVKWTEGPGPISYVPTIQTRIVQGNTEGFFMRYGAVLANQDASYGRGYIYFPVAGNWTFTVVSMWRDTGQFFVNNQLVINGWGYWKPCGFPCKTHGRSGTINIPVAGYYPIQLDWEAQEEQGYAWLYWQGPPGSGIPYEIVPTENLSSCQVPVSCTVDFGPDPATVQIGSSTPLTASVSVVGGGSVDRVNFVSGNSGIASVNPASDDTVVYSTDATGVSAGSTTVTANVIVNGSQACSDSATVNVTATANPWWQVKDSDVTAGGDLVSQIPLTCTLPVCNPVFGLQGKGGFPGVPMYSGAYDFLSGAGYGNAAEAPYNWLVNSTNASTKIYDFSYFKRQIPPDVTLTEINTPTVNGGDFNSGGAPSRGYVWYHYDGSTYGDMTISGNVNLTGSRRVILLVEGADLYITGRINIQSPGDGFFMAVVGKDLNGMKGNIVVDPSVSHPTNPGIEGVFLAEGQFRTGAGSDQLWVRGAVAAYGGFLLERDLGGAPNTTKPAELFEYAPDIMSVFPQVFTTRRIRWKEVAP